jgi:AcrR family transcriptional regulator
MPSLSRELVLATARAQLERTGAQQLSLRAVARELEVTAPALYLYVQDKRDLLAALAEEHFERLVERFEAVDDPDPLVRIRGLSRAYVDHARSSPALFALMFRYPPTAIPESDAFPPAARAFELATRTTTAAIEAGVLAPMEPSDASTVMWCAMHGVAEIALMGFVADDDAVNALLDRVVDTVLAGQIAPLTADRSA